MARDVSHLWSPYFDVSSDCVKILDTGGQIMHANPVALGIMGFDAPPPGILWPDGLSPRSRTEAHRALHTVDRDGRARFYGNSVSPVGTVRQWDTQITPIRADGATYALSVSREITDEIEMFSDVLARSGTDDLTEVRNRRSALSYLDTLRRCADESRTTMAVLMVDIDGFTSINNRFGHPAGDAVLRATALRLRLLAESSSGMVGRIGGDEFVLAFVGEFDYHRLHRLCRRVIDLAHKPISIPAALGRDEVSASLTVGASLYPVCGTDIGTLLAHADDALMQQKHERRGLARVAI